MTSFLTVADFSGGSHPSDEAVRDLVAGLGRAGVRRRPMSANPGKVLERLRLRAPHWVARPEAVLVPMMGKKWWLLQSASLHSTCIAIFAWDLWEPDIAVWLERLDMPPVKAVITSSSDACRALRKHLPGKSVAYLPEAVETSKFTTPAPLQARAIDVLELGRRHEGWHSVVTPHLLETGRRHIYQPAPGVLAFRSTESLVEGLHQTKVLICFSRAVTHPESAGSFDALTQRYLEGISAGCLLLGSCPRDLRDLFGYEPVIPVDWTDPVRQVLEISSHIEDFQVLVDRNLDRLRAVGTWDIRGPELRTLTDTMLREGSGCTSNYG